MFGPAGHLYVYFTYGMHWCANAVCHPPGSAGAVLLRAVEPLTGMPEMAERRGRAIDLANGPAKVCQAFGIDGSYDGVDLVRPHAGGPRIVDDGVPPPEAPVVSCRIGLSTGADTPWRWLVPGSRYVSRGVVEPATLHHPGRSQSGSTPV